MIKKILYETLKKLIIYYTTCLFRKPSSSFKPNKVKKILIIAADYIGDTLFITPLLPIIRKNYPSAHISIWVKSASEEVVEINPYINDILVFDKYKIIQGYNYLHYSLCLKEKINFLRQLRLKKFDLVLDCSGIITTNLFAFFSGAKIVTGFAHKGIPTLLNKPILDKEHISYTDRLYKLLNSLGISEHVGRPEYFIPDKSEDFANQFININKIYSYSLLIGVHPVAGWAAKRWQQEKFSKLISLILQRYNAQIILFGSNSDLQILKFIESLVSKKLLIVAGKTTLHETAALIKKCQLVIANDSIILHLAESFGIPTIGIYGPTNPKFSARGDKNHIHINKTLDCSPVNKEYCSKNAGIDGKCKTFNCMQLLTVENVWEITQQQISKILAKNHCN